MGIRCRRLLVAGVVVFTGNLLSVVVSSVRTESVFRFIPVSDFDHLTGFPGKKKDSPEQIFCSVHQYHTDPITKLCSSLYRKQPCICFIQSEDSFHVIKTACTRTLCRLVHLPKLCSSLFPFWKRPILFSATIGDMKRTKKNNKAASGGPLPRGFMQIGAMTWQGNPVELWLQKKTGELAFVMNGSPVEDEKTIDALQDYLQKANRPEE